MEKILVSACLLGTSCKYSGGSNYNQRIIDYIEGLGKSVQVILVCPEVMGGLSTPRDPAEICRDRVLTEDGRDVTEAYQKGAEETLRLAREGKCRYAILKERSPSCGCGEIYDGTFTHSLTTGDGMTAALLKRSGIVVLGESSELPAL